MSFGLAGRVERRTLEQAEQSGIQHGRTEESKKQEAGHAAVADGSPKLAPAILGTVSNVAQDELDLSRTPVGRIMDLTPDAAKDSYEIPPVLLDVRVGLKPIRVNLTF